MSQSLLWPGLHAVIPCIEDLEPGFPEFRPRNPTGNTFAALRLTWVLVV